jgi:hypothetical protein
MKEDQLINIYESIVNEDDTSKKDIISGLSKMHKQMQQQILDDKKLQTEIALAADNVFEAINQYRDLLRANRKDIIRILRDIENKGIEDDTPEADFYFTIKGFHENASDLLHVINID